MLCYAFAHWTNHVRTLNAIAKLNLCLRRGTATRSHATSLSFAKKTRGVTPPHFSLQKSFGVTPPCWALLELLEVGVSVLEVKIAFVDVDISLLTDEVEQDLTTCSTVCLFNG